MSKMYGRKRTMRQISMLRIALRKRGLPEDGGIQALLRHEREAEAERNRWLWTTLETLRNRQTRLARLCAERDVLTSDEIREILESNPYSARQKARS